MIGGGWAFRANQFRVAHVLPSSMIYRVDNLSLQAIRFLPGYRKAGPWWKADQLIQVDFESGHGDDRPRCRAVCADCGLCCKNLPDHQIAIYFTEQEMMTARWIVPSTDPWHFISIQGRDFYIGPLTQEGHCRFLGPDGCLLGQEDCNGAWIDMKPLWCKIYYCAKFQGGEYEFAKTTDGE